MGKIILLLLIIGGIYFFFIKKTPQKTEEEENEFQQCDRCKTFVLKKELKEKNGQLLCKDCYANS